LHPDTSDAFLIEVVAVLGEDFNIPVPGKPKEKKSKWYRVIVDHVSNLFGEKDIYTLFTDERLIPRDRI
jgi:hypothetical protein